MIVDIAIVLIFLLICWISYRRGFLATLLTIASGIFSLVIVYILAGPVAKTLVQSGIFNGFRTNVELSLASRLNQTGGSIGQALAGLGIPESWSSRIVTESTAASGNAARYAAEQLTHLVAGVAAIILLFVFFQIVVRFFLKRLAKGVNRIPIIGMINRVGGFLLGGLWALLILYFLSLAVSALAPAVPLFATWMNESVLLGYLAKTPLFLRAYEAVAKRP